MTLNGSDRAALLWFAERLDPAALLCSRYPPCSWVSLRPPLTALYGLDGRSHFLNSPPSFVDRLWERQITVAMRNVLEGDPALRLERCRALFEACGAPADDPPVSVTSIEADHPVRRLDLAVHVVAASGRRRCLLIEAKFGAPLQPDQLRRYRDLVSPEYLEEDQRVLRVVGSSPPASFAGRHRQEEWQFVHWSSLLRRWQRSLPSGEIGTVLQLMAQIWKQG